MSVLSLPAHGEIHVWRRSLLVPAAEGAAFFALLDPGERQRAARFHFERDRDAFIASHGWLRTLLGCNLQSDPRNIRSKDCPRIRTRTDDFR